MCLEQSRSSVVAVDIILIAESLDRVQPGNPSNVNAYHITRYSKANIPNLLTGVSVLRFLKSSSL